MNLRRRPEARNTGWRRIAPLLDNAKSARAVLTLILGALGSLPLVILTPPFQAPDEVQHFYRAYQLSEFHLRAEVQNGEAGGTLPRSLSLLVKSSVYTADGVLYPATPAPIAKTLQLKSIPLDPSTRQFVAFPGAAIYSPLPYLPQALGIAAGRLIGSGPLVLFYLGRLFNCLSALALLGLAVNFMPFAEELVILAGLLPMSQYLYASFSPDAALIGCALVFSALSIAASARRNWSTRELWIAAIAASVFCSVKPVYAPLLLAAMDPGVFRPGEAVKVIRSNAILLGAVLGVTAGWFFIAKPAMTTPLDGTHPMVQINLVLHQPMVLAHILAHTLDIRWLVGMYVQAVGEFGWLTVLLKPGVVYLLPLVSVVLFWRLGIRGPQVSSARRALWHLALALTCAVLILVALYLTCARVGQDRVLGVQGRYFIPIFVITGMAAIELVPNRRPSAPQWQILMSMAVISVLETAAMDTTIIRAFHVF